MKRSYKISSSVTWNVAYLMCVCADNDDGLLQMCYKSNSRMKKNVKSEKFKDICVENLFLNECKILFIFRPIWYLTWYLVSKIN